MMSLPITLPNLLSALRMAFIPLFIIAVLEGQMLKAIGIFTLAGITDLLDGAIARFYHQQSVLGAYLDPAADKLLLTSAYIMLAIPGLHSGFLIPIWVTVLVITRDVIIVVVALIVYLALGISDFPPSRISKWNTAAQITAIFLVLLSGLDGRLESLALGSVFLVVLLTTASGLEYAYRFIYRAPDLAEKAPKASAGGSVERSRGHVVARSGRDGGAGDSSDGSGLPSGGRGDR